MVDTNSTDLLAEIEQKRRRFVLWPIVAALSLILAGVIFATGTSPWLSIPFIILLSICIFAVHQLDQLKKSVVLMYDLDGAMLDSYQRMFESVESLASCGMVWHVSGRGDVYDPRYHAGAGALLNRSRITIGFRRPPYVKTNVSVPCLPLGTISLNLLPDYQSRL